MIGMLKEAVRRVAGLKNETLLKLFGVVRLDGVTLFADDPAIGAVSRRTIIVGAFERHERRALRRHVHPDDRVLELGSGIGFITTRLAQTVGSENVLGFEANPDLFPVMHSHFARNGVAPRVENAVLGAEDGETSFYVGDEFWSASATDERAGRKITVPAKALKSITAEFQPTVLMMDIEGGEREIIDLLDPGSLRLLIMEVHPEVLGEEGETALFSRIADMGFKTKEVSGRHSPETPYVLVSERS